MNNASHMPKYWRSLDELEGSEEFQEFVHREFPTAASEIPAGVSRRRWLQIMGASFALAGVAGCRWETEKIAPFADRPDGRIPGEPQRYATSIEYAGKVRHLLVTCYDGRPIKVEGNREHPDSLGASDGVSQASILDLYDPDRKSTLQQVDGRQSFTRTWDEFEGWLARRRRELIANQGQGLAVLADRTSSLSLLAALRQIQDRFPQSRLYFDDSSGGNEKQGVELAFGRPLEARLDVSRARVILTLDCDLLQESLDAIRLTREYAENRDPDGEWMNRLYAVESSVSITGAAADHRLPLRSSDIARVVAILERQLRASAESTALVADVKQSLSHLPETKLARVSRFLEAVVDDLRKHSERSLIVVGANQPAAVHARVHRLNHELGNVGQTVHLFEDPMAAIVTGGLPKLAFDIADGEVETLIVLGCNPVHTAPADLRFNELVSRVPHSVSLASHDDETLRLCSWQLPMAHPLETWGDVRASDGTISVTQPLIRPLLDGKSPLELLAMLTGDPRDAQTIVRESIEGSIGDSMSQRQWRRVLHDGVFPESRAKEVRPKLADLTNQDEQHSTGGQTQDVLELVISLSPAIYDGRLANNGWLQETPDAITKLTWDNAAILSPATAENLGIRSGTLVEITAHGRSLRVPAFILPGQADNSIALSLGYGRTAAGRVGGSDSQNVPSVGVNANRLRQAGEGNILRDLRITPTNIPFDLATTQNHHALDTLAWEESGRRVGELVREGTLDVYAKHADFAQHVTHHPPLEPAYEGHAWGMSIDLNKCIGCNACSVACQAENNVPVVGKDQVLRGREMHWIRIDRYFSGETADPSIAHQPVTCHHCENAPCEQVCPVAATVHSDEGLNDMIYNRCVGTRYCANNCPYKVRRFNFFDYNANLTADGNELVQLGVNPEVTVRSRGVMEKCTYCVQRIQKGKIDAKNEGRPVRDGEIVTACQQACPAQAIEFGDLNDSSTKVARAHADPRAYGMLAELNVKPRTKYLARIRNPHPLLAESTKRSHQHESH